MKYEYWFAKIQMCIRDSTIAGQDAGKNAELMRQLKEEGVYEITEEMLSLIHILFRLM